MAERYSAVATPHGRGVTEKQISAGSGLRVYAGSIQKGPQASGILPTAGGVLLGRAGGAKVPTAGETAAGIYWRSVYGNEIVPNPGPPGVSMPRVVSPVPCTPVLTIVRNNNSTAARVRWRVCGLNQFGESTVEITPWVSFSTNADAIVHSMFLSKVFSLITSVEYQSFGLDATSTGTGFTGGVTGDRLYMGTVFGSQPIDSVTANRYQTYGTEAHNGIGLPIRVFGQGAKPEPKLMPEIMACSVRNVTNLEGLGGDSWSAFFAYDGSNTGFDVGYSLPGWEGDANKLVFRSNNWGAYAGDVGFRGQLAVPDPIAGLGALYQDLAEINLWIRTGIGTQLDGSKGFTDIYQRG